MRRNTMTFVLLFCFVLTGLIVSLLHVAFDSGIEQREYDRLHQEQDNGVHHSLRDLEEV